MPRVFRAIIQGLVVTILLFFLAQILINLYDVQGIYKDFFLNNMWYTITAIVSVFILFVFFPYNTTIKKTILTIIVLFNVIVGMTFFSGLEGYILVYRLIILAILSITQILLGQRKSTIRYTILPINMLCMLVVISILLLPSYDDKPTLSSFYTLQSNTLHMFIADAPLILQEANPILSYRIGTNERTIPITVGMSFLPISFTQDIIVTLSATQNLQNTYAIVQMYDGSVYPIPSQAGIELTTLGASGYQIKYINSTGDVTPSLAAQGFMESLIEQREQAFQNYITDTIGGQWVLHPIVDGYIHIMLQVAYTIFPEQYFENIQNYYSTQVLLEQLGMKEKTDITTHINIDLPDTTQFQESIQQTFLYKRLFMTE